MDLKTVYTKFLIVTLFLIMYTIFNLLFYSFILDGTKYLSIKLLN